MPKQWKNEICNIAKAFCVSPFTCRAIIQAVEGISTDNMPAYYKGNKNAYLYDAAYRKLKKYLIQ